MEDSVSMLFDNSSQELPKTAEPTRSVLEANGALLCGRGTLTLRGRSAKLFEAIDRNVSAFSASIGAESVILPATLGLDNFRQSGYLNLFPHLVSLVSALDTESGNFSAFRNRLSSSDSIALLPHLKEPERVCSSAVCLSSYPRFAGKVFAQEDRVTLTAMGRAFRREMVDPNNPLRLLEFNVREIIFFGSAEFVRSSLKRSANWMRELLLEGGLRGGIQTAEDPFFAPDARALAAYQRAAMSKHELVLNKPNSSEVVAVASINNHETHFSKSYEIKFANGDFIHTGCFAVGLERLLLMLVFQYGFDTAVWPEKLRDRFNF